MKKNALKYDLSPSHTWQLFLEIQSNFYILVAKQVAKKMIKKLQANCFMCESLQLLPQQLGKKMGLAARFVLQFGDQNGSG